MDNRNYKGNTIFIIVTRGFIVRNILRSGTLEALLRASARVVVIFDAAEVPAYLAKEFQHEQITLEACRITLPRLHRFLLRFEKYFFRSATTKLLISFRQGSKDRQKFREGHVPRKSSVAFLVERSLLFVLGGIPFLKRAFRFLENRLFPERYESIQRLFDTHKPDVLFSTSIISSLDIAFMKEAKRRSIRTVSMPKTWDNMLNKYFSFVPDVLVVHNEVAKQAARTHQHIQSERIKTVGMPQFDWYRRPEILRSRDAHWRGKGLDPSKAVIFFGSVGIWGANDHAVAELIYSWIERGELGRPCQLFLRPHFSNVRDDVFKKLRGKLGVVIDEFRVVDTFSDNWDPTIEETIDFTNSVAHSDVMINFGSTLTLDAAAVDRPTVNPAFGCSFQGGEDVTYPYQYGADHYQWVLRENATLLSFTPEELKEQIQDCLHHPEKKRAERKKLIAALCYKVDGRSSERLAGGGLYPKP